MRLLPHFIQCEFARTDKTFYKLQVGPTVCQQFLRPVVLQQRVHDKGTKTDYTCAGCRNSVSRAARNFLPRG